MKKIKSFDGVKVAYNFHKGKNDHVLVFLHGVGGNWTTWKKEITYFKKKGYSTLGIDFRGHGESDAPDEFEKYKTEFFAKDLGVVLQKEKINKFSLIGHSIGGGVAICYESFHPEHEPQSIILVEPSPVYPFKHDDLLHEGKFLTKLIRYIAYNTHIKNKYFPHMKDCDLSNYEHNKMDLLHHLVHVTPIRSLVYTLDQGETYMKESKKKIENTFKELKCPLLVISSENDKITPPCLTKKIIKWDKLAKFYFVKNADHAVIVEKPQEISKAINEFLENN